MRQICSILIIQSGKDFLRITDFLEPGPAGLHFSRHLEPAAQLPFLPHFQPHQASSYHPLYGRPASART